MFNELTSLIRKIGGRRLPDTMTFCLILSRHRGRMLPACAATLALATAFPVQGGFAGDGIAPRAVATRVGRGPNLDGSLGDECYRRAQRISGFSRLRGGAPPTQKAEAYLVWTKTALYIAMKCYEAKPDAMVAIAKEHDSAVAADDSIQLFLDTNHDHKTYYLEADSLETQAQQKQQFCRLISASPARDDGLGGGAGTQAVVHEAQESSGGLVVDAGVPLGRGGR